MVSNGSLITKKVIAYSFKDLMKTKDFQKISITEIMSHADYRRQTFYDHFSDKYELLAWIYEQEITEIVEHFINYEHWTKIIPRLLSYFKKNQVFYKKALSLTEQNSFDQYFVLHTQQFILTILNQNKHRQTTTKSKDLANFAKFFAFGLSGFIKEWVLDGCTSPENELSNFLIQTLTESLTPPTTTGMNV